VGRAVAQEERVSPMTSKQTYLGDGVYAEFDGWQIWLGLEKGERLIALEPSVMERLKDYDKLLYTPINEGAQSDEN
jgi:hypothetical protein